MQITYKNLMNLREEIQTAIFTVGKIILQSVIQQSYGSFVFAIDLSASLNMKRELGLVNV